MANQSRSGQFELDGMLREIECPNVVVGQWFVYILESADAAFYIGQTCNLRERLRKHRLGSGSKHTHDHVSVRLVHCEPTDSLGAAVRRERQLKGWSRDKKIALITGRRDALQALSRNHEAVAAQAKNIDQSIGPSA